MTRKWGYDKDVLLMKNCWPSFIIFSITIIESNVLVTGKRMRREREEEKKIQISKWEIIFVIFECFLLQLLLLPILEFCYLEFWMRKKHATNTDLGMSTIRNVIRLFILLFSFLFVLFDYLSDCYSKSLESIAVNSMLHETFKVLRQYSI